MNRIQEFTNNGRIFIYYDLSDFKTVDDYKKLIDEAKAAIVKYPKSSLYTITNIKDVKFDTEVKRVVSEWMTFNKPYVKSGTVIGVDGMKKIALNTIFALSGRSNMNCVSTKDDAIAWLMKQK
jgi:hypothetical protein